MCYTMWHVEAYWALDNRYWLLHGCIKPVTVVVINPSINPLRPQDEGSLLAIASCQQPHELMQSQEMPKILRVDKRD